MYLERMIAEAPVGRRYADRPFDSVDELLLMIDEVLTLAPEFGDEMAATPLGAVRGRHRVPGVPQRERFDALPRSHDPHPPLKLVTTALATVRR